MVLVVYLHAVESHPATVRRVVAADVPGDFKPALPVDEAEDDDLSKKRILERGDVAPCFLLRLCDLVLELPDLIDRVGKSESLRFCWPSDLVSTRLTVGRSCGDSH